MKTFKKILMFLMVVNVLLINTATVDAAPKINKKEVTLYVGQTTSLKISDTKSKAKWKSSKTSVATVNSKGKVTAKKSGSATITAAAGSKKYTCKVTVKNPFLNSTEKSLYENNTYILKLTGAKVKSFSSSNKSIASVSSKGKITVKKTGFATITVKDTNGKKYLCKITVKTPGLNATKKTLNVNGTYTLKLTGATAKSFSSSDKDVASVNSKGKITAKKAGSATITVKDSNNKSYTCEITVKGKSQAQDTEVPAHTHKYSSEVTTQPTCTENGIRTYTCSCGDTYTETIAKKAHSAGDWIVETAATEDTTGREVQKCTVCGAVIDSRVIDMLPHTHDYTVEKQEPTCTEKGYTIEICKKCGDTKYTNETEALGHEAGEPEIVDGTIIPFKGYYTPGAKEVKCTRCGVTLESTPVIPEEGTPYDDVDSIYSVYCGKDSDGNAKYTYVVGHYDDNDAREMFDLVNKYRVENGKTEYEWTDSEKIEQYMETRAKEIAVLYDHIRPCGYRCRYSENIAMSTIGLDLDRGVYYASTEEIFNAWLDSEGHRNNILGFQEKTCIKVFYLKKAYAQVSGEYRYLYEPYWVEEFYTD